MEMLWRGIGAYLLGINLATFAVRGRDKGQSKRGKRRISEKTLLTLSLRGGMIGALLAIEVFRHKTIKGSFLWKFYLVGAVWILGILGIALWTG